VVDLLRVGRSLRALRIRRGYRQLDVAEAAGLSRAKVARIEAANLRRIPLGDLDAVAQALGADLELRIRWHGEGLDRLLDAAHAALVERVVRLLLKCGWEPSVEVSFNLGGERGSIDVLARHAPTGAVLVVEVKSVVPDAQSMLAGLDRKARLAPAIAGTRGWTARQVGRLLVIGDTSTSRRRVDSLEAVLATTYPDRAARVRAWLRDPSGPLSGLLFLPYVHGVSGRRMPMARQRVRRSMRRPIGP
jgi:transcriptional regulator with XRE-family HTH domain